MLCRFKNAGIFTLGKHDGHPFSTDDFLQCIDDCGHLTTPSYTIIRNSPYFSTSVSQSLQRHVKINSGDTVKTINTLLFDLDGTLIDSNDIIIASYAHAYRTHLPDLVMPRETIIDNIGPTLETIFSRYAPDVAMVERLIASYRAHYTAHEATYHTLYPDVHIVLEQLKRDGYNLAIVTSKYRDAAMPSFTHYELDRYFDVFISLDDVTYSKPDKEPVLKALEQFDHVTGAIMIGDNPTDVQAGKNAGILAAGVGWSIKGAAALEAVGADVIFRDMNHLYHTLTLWNKEVTPEHEKET
ncbi:MAG: HAD family hydrolase [Acholeplasmatales bacterium]|nr:MAG: HAD family hydrolase [Acholeplasmatales bacterium]